MFASADLKWMDYLDERGRIAAGTRANLLGNTLVLIAPKGRRFAVTMQPGFDLAGAFNGKLCTGEPGVVPVGIYAKQSLEKLGWWPSLQGRIVGTDDVRTALAFVERGECALGIVYATDARISDKVEVLAQFPADTHMPDRLSRSPLSKDARTADAAPSCSTCARRKRRAIFAPYGFTVLKALTRRCGCRRRNDRRSGSRPRSRCAPPRCACRSASRWRGWLERRSFPGKFLIDALVQLPMVLPPVVPGYLLLLLLGTQGPLGHWLRSAIRHRRRVQLEGRGARVGGDGLSADGAADPARVPPDRRAPGAGRGDAGRAAVARVLRPSRCRSRCRD